MTESRRGRLRSNDPAGMRARILDAAADLFQARGYGDTSVQDVKRAAGVTSGAFHHHFASKKALGLAVVQERVADALRAAWLDPLDSAPDVAAGVGAAFDAIAGALGAQRFVQGCPVSNLAVELAFSDADFRAALQPLFAGWQALLARRLRAEGMPPAFADTPSEELAAAIVALYSGAMTMAKAEQSPVPLRQAARTAQRLLARP